VRHTAPLPINTSKPNLWGGRGAGTPAPKRSILKKLPQFLGAEIG